MEKRDLIYEILKTIERGVEPKHSEMNVAFEAFADAVEQIDEDRLATSIVFSRGGQTNKILVVFANGSKLTREGRKFIELKETGKL